MVDGTTMQPLYNFHDGIAMVPRCHFDGTTMVLRWYHDGTTMVLRWYYDGTAVRMVPCVGYELAVV